MRRRVPAYTIYLIIQGSFGLFFTMMSLVSAIYRLQNAGLDPLQLVLVGTVLETTVFIFEIPTACLRHDIIGPGDMGLWLHLH